MFNTIKSYWNRLINPQLTADQIQFFWQSAFNKGLRKAEILKFVRRNFGVHPSELRRRQLKSVLQQIQTMEVNLWR
jgi:hypothetical protein